MFISCRFFNQNGDLKYFHVATPPPPYPQTLTAFPTPVLGGTPRYFFFHQNDRKGCKRDYLDARGHFVLHFAAIGDKPLGGVTTPLGRRSLSIPVTSGHLKSNMNIS